MNTAPNLNNRTEARRQTIRSFTLARNQKLIDRFDFYYKEKRLRYDDVLEKLENEFFITKTRIIKIIKNPEL